LEYRVWSTGSASGFIQYREITEVGLRIGIMGMQVEFETMGIK
jgi:hypothetical protein